MKKTPTLLLLACLAGGCSLMAAEQPTNAPVLTDPVLVSTTNAPGTGLLVTNVMDSASATNQVLATDPVIDSFGTNTPFLASTNFPQDGLRLNFRGVPLDMVLNYLSEAAGFVIILEANVQGKVDVWSNTPVTKDEAVDLLNTVLNKNGYAAIRNDRTLVIVNKDEAKSRDIPVKTGSDPLNIPRNNEIVTQIIGVRFIEAAQLIKDLTPLVSVQTTMTANEAGNAIVITDTQANIHRIAEIIKAIDSGAEDITEVRVFRLKNADPVEMSDVITSVFPDDSRSGGGSQAPVQFGGGGFGGMRAMFGGGGRGGNAGGGAAGGASAQRAKKKPRVIAVADQRTASIVVSATRDLIEQISQMVSQLDENAARKQKVYVYTLQNADTQDVEPLLRNMFDRNGTMNSRNSTTTTQNPLNTRITQSQRNTSSTGSSFGTSRGVGGGGGGN